MTIVKHGVLFIPFPHHGRLLIIYSLSRVVIWSELHQKATGSLFQLEFEVLQGFIIV